jgi:hypothetical protein
MKRVEFAAAALTLAVSVIALSACGSSSQSSAGLAPSAVQKPWKPPSARGRLIVEKPGALRLGAPVVPRELLKPRVFADAEHGYALALIQDITYPAKTLNGGKSWRVDGPLFNRPPPPPPAIQAIGVASARTAFAWDGLGGGSLVAVTTDGGAHWWKTSLPGVVLSVAAEGAYLQANIYGIIRKGRMTHNGLWAYQTTTGRRWKFAYDFTPRG